MDTRREKAYCHSVNSMTNGTQERWLYRLGYASVMEASDMIAAANYGVSATGKKGSTPVGDALI